MIPELCDFAYRFLSDTLRNKYIRAEVFTVACHRAILRPRLKVCGDTKKSPCAGAGVL
jgi:hypothetical protein